MRWRENLNNLVDSPYFKWVVFSLFGVAAGYALWANFHPEIKSSAIGALMILGGLIEQTTWYFWVFAVAAIIWMRANRKNRQRQEAILQLLAEIRDKLR
jgi:hypothetical protein